MAKFTDAQLKEALTKAGGIQAAAAAQLGVTRASVHQRIHKSEEMIAHMEECMESRLDLAESALMRAIGKGEAWAICFFLKCRGKERGYIEQIQVDTTVRVGVLHSIIEESNQILATVEPRSFNELPADMRAQIPDDRRNGD